MTFLGRSEGLDLKSRFDNFDGGEGKLLLVALVVPSRCAPKVSTTALSCGSQDYGCFH